MVRAAFGWLKRWAFSRMALRRAGFLRRRSILKGIVVSSLNLMAAPSSNR